jgi:hypothetical protein
MKFFETKDISESVCVDLDIATAESSIAVSLSAIGHKLNKEVLEVFLKRDIVKLLDVICNVKQTEQPIKV